MDPPQPIFSDLGKSETMSLGQLRRVEYNLKERTAPLLKHELSYSGLFMIFSLIWLIALGAAAQPPLQQLAEVASEQAMFFACLSFGSALVSAAFANLALSWIYEIVFGLKHMIAAAEGEPVHIEGFNHGVARRMRKGVFIAFYISMICNLLSVTFFLMSLSMVVKPGLCVAAIGVAGVVFILVSTVPEGDDRVFGKTGAFFKSDDSRKK